MRHMVPAFIFRLRARKAMKPVMSILILVVLIAMLPSLISNVLTMITESDPSVVIAELYTQERMDVMMSGDPEATAAVSDEIMNGLTTFLQEKWPFMALTVAITFLITPVLTLGQNHTLLKALRKEEFSVATVFARMPIFFKAIGLQLMTALRIFLWTLPGMALSLVGAVLLLLAPSVGGLVFLAAMVLTFVLSIQAMYRYRMATFVMADDASTGINAAIRRSCDVMNGRKMELFSLEISFVGWRLVVSMLQMMFVTMLGSVVGMTLGLFASFFVSMYMNMAEAAFYQEYAVSPTESTRQLQDELMEK